jgi:hypothetical protein
VAHPTSDKPTDRPRYRNNAEQIRAIGASWPDGQRRKPILVSLIWVRLRGCEQIHYARLYRQNALGPKRAASLRIIQRHIDTKRCIYIQKITIAWQVKYINARLKESIAVSAPRLEAVCFVA